MFMEGVEKVEQLDDTTLRWKASIAGQERTWKARITEQLPDERVAWTSIDGAKNAGVVTFHRLGENLTRGTLQLDVDPDGPVDNIGDALRLVQRRGQGGPGGVRGIIQGRGGPTRGGGGTRGPAKNPT